MNLVVDANVVIASLVKDSVTSMLLVDPLFTLYAPEFILEEIQKYGREIAEKTHRTLENVSALIGEILQIVTISPSTGMQSYNERASNISPDSKDAPYFALALKLDCALWSNDRRLKEQKIVTVYSTEEILGLRRQQI